MALRKKGSRLITVNDVEYRWVVASDKKGIHLVIEHAEQPGQRLVVAFHRKDEHGEATTVTPTNVKDIIEIGLQKEWNPTKQGQQLHLGQGEEILQYF